MLCWPLHVITVTYDPLSLSLSLAHLHYIRNIFFSLNLLHSKTNRRKQARHSLSIFFATLKGLLSLFSFVRFAANNNGWSKE
uniref:Uncharacterized protein n=1 Tax=Salix viminalis TaxID=40686 RepID=A0A6N2LU58_SALVM